MKKNKEIETVTLMIKIYCHGVHKTKRGELCPKCNELLDFVISRRDKCPYGDDKNFCSQCKIHCYKSDPEKRKQIKEVMRYSAPRMCFSHPILTFKHLKATIKGKLEAKKKKGIKND